MMRPRQDLPILPLLVTPRNAELALGVKWRWCVETARALGLRVIRVRGKSMIEAAPLVDALKREADRNVPTPLTDDQERDAMRERLGLVRGAA